MSRGYKNRQKAKERQRRATSGNRVDRPLAMPISAEDRDFYANQLGLKCCEYVCARCNQAMYSFVEHEEQIYIDGEPVCANCRTLEEQEEGVWHSF